MITKTFREIGNTLMEILNYNRGIVAPILNELVTEPQREAFLKHLKENRDNEKIMNRWDLMEKAVEH